MLRRDEDGVASTVATLFTIITVLLFMSAAFAIEDVRQKDREWTLVNEAATAFGTLRSVSDIQFAKGIIPLVSPEDGWEDSAIVVIPVGMPTTSPFTPPIVGRLACDPGPSVASVGFSYRAGLGILDAVEGSGGVLSLQLRTRHLPDTRLVWENGATLLVQGGHAVVIDYPYFQVEPVVDGVHVTYRVLRLVDDRWGVEDTGPQFMNVHTVAAESYTLDVAGGGPAHLDEVQQFVFDLAREIYDASTDGSGRITGSYADTGTDDPAPPHNPNPGILNQGLKQQLVYYSAALEKQQNGDCTSASNEMNASARQLLQNTMDKILLGIDEGYIEEAWGLDLHSRLGALLHCLDEMSESLEETCEFSCLSLFGGGGGRLEFLISSDYRAAWGQWYREYLDDALLDVDQWEVINQLTFILLQIDSVQQITFQVSYVTFQ